MDTQRNLVSRLSPLKYPQSWPKARTHLQLSGKFLAYCHHSKETSTIPPPISVGFGPMKMVLKSIWHTFNIAWGGERGGNWGKWKWLSVENYEME